MKDRFLKFLGIATKDDIKSLNEKLSFLNNHLDKIEALISQEKGCLNELKSLERVVKAIPKEIVVKNVLSI